MFGTLIGIFLTSAGIVIGADTVLWGVGVPGPVRGEKHCIPGERSVAVFEGWFGEDRALYRQFHDQCHVLARSKKPLHLEVQADRLIQRLEQTYRERTGPFPPQAASLPPPVSKHVASVAVAGFDGITPVVTVRELRWEKTRKGRWRLITERIGKLSMDGCGAKFLGEDGIASLLLDSSAQFGREKQRSDVRDAARANRLRAEEQCFLSTFTVEEAKSLYKLAVRLTIDHGDMVHIDPGAVGGRLHLVTIPNEGSLDEERIDPEAYLE
ncbi:hypothetical protein ACO9S2_12470 [Nitrospira sp. NS4]|uniref:hypothetical protein n=1 Tax=Nitrospira sp. NS4 TaxID=3414498 RepID=UPI003C30CB61